MTGLHRGDEPAAWNARASVSGLAIDVVVPVLDEAGSIASVVEAFRPLVRRVVVVDNGSADGSGTIAKEAGATVVTEPVRGYGAACLAGLSLLRADPPSIVAFEAGGA